MCFKYCFKLPSQLLAFFLIFELFCVSRPVIQKTDNFIQPVDIQARITEEEDKVSALLESLKLAGSPAEIRYLGKFKMTFYWIVKEADYNGPKTKPLYLENGQLLGYFCPKFVADFKKESCAELRDGRRISYLKKADKAKLVNEFLGYGGYTITPLLSVAVDPSIIPIGSKLYIPIFTKINAQQHNGIVYAHDIGSLIKNHTIDIFVGYKENMSLFTSVGINSSDLIDVYVLD